MKRLTVTSMIVAIVLPLGSGCNKSERPHLLSSDEKRDLEKEIVLSLPDRVELLLADDGSMPGETGTGFYRWVLFSQQPIEMSPGKVPRASGYLEHADVSGMTKRFHNLTRRVDTTGATASSFLSWHTGEYDIQGSLLNTAHGNYLYIERFEKSGAEKEADARRAERSAATSAASGPQ